MPLLFSYGTHQQSNDQLATFGRLLHGQQDELLGFTLSLVRIEDPQLVATSGTVFEITATDPYEKSGRYVRVAQCPHRGKRRGCTYTRVLREPHESQT